MPEITVVVPVYNGEEHLAATIESILAQTFTDFELLAIDDGSTDRSADIVRSYSDSRIRLIQKQNSGLCSTLNLGIAEARSIFLARSDQDDLSVPERLQRQFAALKSVPDALALFGYNSKFGGKHDWSNKDKFSANPGVVSRYEPMVDGCLLGSTMLARVDALRAVGGYREEYYPVDDWDLECRLAQAGHVLVLKEALTAYRFQAGANTYRVFSEMQIKTRWTADSFHRRERGIPELSYQDFLSQEPQSFWHRLSRQSKESSMWNMRTGGQSYLDGEYFTAARRLSAACLLDPRDAIKRAARLVVSACS